MYQAFLVQKYLRGKVSIQEDLNDFSARVFSRNGETFFLFFGRNADPKSAASAEPDR